ncbi:hypothetical protein [Yoonia sp. R2-816]|uniref:hypothetical protein n=1 Tax=Yoonia sp. R2-816 TaxID=3342638 RepID=UPI00372703E4
MVPGIEKFREHFAGHEDSYALIGGAACALIFEEVGLEFRATRDVDMVLCVEVVDPSFGTALKGFLDAGQYEARERGAERREFYRFHKPKDTSYPEMLELFSSPEAGVDLEVGDELATVAISDDMLSLSAILLDKDYYDALINSRRPVDGIHVLDERLLIPFKARAFVDLTRRRAEGDAKIKGSDIAKHRRDVFRLLQLLNREETVEVNEPLKDDLRAYRDILKDDGTFHPPDFGVDIERSESFELLTALYVL